MASQTVSALQWTCDGCGRVKVIPEDGLPAGYHGVANDVQDDGARTLKDVIDSAQGWWACSKRCIRRAVLAATGQTDADGDE